MNCNKQILSADSIWHTSTQQQQQQHQQNQQNHWQMTTEPSFITKPRPTGWTKPGIVNLPMPARPSKPSKPTKKPIVYDRSPPPPSSVPPSTSTSTTSTSLIWPAQTHPRSRIAPPGRRYVNTSLVRLWVQVHVLGPGCLVLGDALMSKAKQTSHEVIYSSTATGTGPPTSAP